MKITHLAFGKPIEMVEIPDNSTIWQVCELLYNISSLQRCCCGYEGIWFHNDIGQHINVYVNGKPVTDMNKVLADDSSIFAPPPLWCD
jgi:hypothetical protein